MTRLRRPVPQKIMFAEHEISALKKAFPINSPNLEADLKGL